MDDYNIDDIADLAEADVDIMGDPEIAEMGEELGIENINEDLDINDDIADLGNEDNFDFNDDAFANDDGFGAEDLGDAGDGDAGG